MGRRDARTGDRRPRDPGLGRRAPARERRRRPGRPGHGHGRALVSFAESHARELSLAAVELYTNEAMAENIRALPAARVRRDRAAPRGRLPPCLLQKDPGRSPKFGVSLDNADETPEGTDRLRHSPAPARPRHVVDHLGRHLRGDPGPPGRRGALDPRTQRHAGVPRSPPGATRARQAHPDPVLGLDHRDLHGRSRHLAREQPPGDGRDRRTARLHALPHARRRSHQHPARHRTRRDQCAEARQCFRPDDVRHDARARRRSRSSSSASRWP